MIWRNFLVKDNSSSFSTLWIWKRNSQKFRQINKFQRPILHEIISHFLPFTKFLCFLLFHKLFSDLFPKNTTFLQFSSFFLQKSQKSDRLGGSRPFILRLTNGRRFHDHVLVNNLFTNPSNSAQFCQKGRNRCFKFLIPFVFVFILLRVHYKRK